MRGNLATSLRRRRRRCPIAQYDRLPPELRRWLAQAALPWSPVSALRLWHKLLDETAGNIEAARQRLDLIEARMLMRDAPRIWGVPPTVPPRQPSPAG
ncbi:DUF6525 family protein [Paracoccus sp. P2]|uniref:Uncharacterized protein n=1 Tax=Paracoccus pantotrophus TaxID=82367 RepID=A0A1I5KEM6_PARPN|nr:DUF6525 family protein [Paracoccus pantotrophus]MDF3855846.1 DUF6525 family protein [Paracoccus pantotrophus]QFG37417.1 hypothetical protein ESD82_14840 [Paracoccus pantotrophus]QLH15116.1 hypothetical protein HYQ43_12800 [Paracoccus pantotrophus]RDD95401.1 hypothetical protein DTW92_16125 [Paracoccus pantotrophus]RKS52139.1 hypothetical protein BDE18_1441 [Paracoccus pantotrophus]